jgi:hypothetical protein
LLINALGLSTARPNGSAGFLQALPGDIASESSSTDENSYPASVATVRLGSNGSSATLSRPKRTNRLGKTIWISSYDLNFSLAEISSTFRSGTTISQLAMLIQNQSIDWEGLGSKYIFLHEGQWYMRNNRILVILRLLAMLDASWKDRKLPFQTRSYGRGCGRNKIRYPIRIGGLLDGGHKILVFDDSDGKKYSVAKGRGESPWLWVLLERGEVRDELPLALWKWLSGWKLPVEVRHSPNQMCSCGGIGSGSFSCDCGYQSTFDCREACRLGHCVNCPTWQREEQGEGRVRKEGDDRALGHEQVKLEAQLRLIEPSGSAAPGIVDALARYELSRAAGWLDQRIRLI